jgi:uncharacterized phage protein gp47/JayE
MSGSFGISPQGFVLKRLNDILSDMKAAMSLVQDPVTLETLNIQDENDPLIQLMNATADQLSVAWEQLQYCYNSFIPSQASGNALSGLVQLNGLLRGLGEVDTALQLRQQLQTMETAAVQIGAIQASVAAIEGVQFCRAYQNSTISNPDNRSIPAKTLAIVVVGGDDLAIANAIFLKAGCDVGYMGNVSKTCTDNQGIPYIISFIRPTQVPISIVVNITVTDTSQWPSTGVTDIENAIVNFAQYTEQANIGLPPGTSVVPSRLYSPINTVGGHEILSVQASRDQAAFSPYITPIAWNEVAQITTGNITVNLQ